MSKNHNYTNYSEVNKPAEPAATEAPESQAPKSDDNIQNLQETENTNGTTPPAPDCETAQPDPDAVIGVVVNCEKLNIRAEAKADAKILGTFFKGQEIEIYLDTSTDDFYDVSVGFCMKKYIKINN